MIEHFATPNPNSMKFCVTGGLITRGASIEFDKNTENVPSRLAKDLLGFDYVESVLYCYDFILVTKNDLKEWSDILSEIIFTILRYEDEIARGTLTLDPNLEDIDDSQVQFNEADRKTVHEISEFLNEVVRPQIAMDGGDIRLKGYKNGIVYLQLRGASSSNPTANVTLYNGIRQILIENIPDVIDVEQV
jgi:Fe-S cluster biogenesis protein NfuA